DPQAPEITASPALSLTARPGSVGIRTRKVAILVAEGVDGDQVRGAAQALQDEGAVVRLLGPRIGPFKASDGSLIDADASLENQPAVLFDGFLAPDGATAADAPAVDGLAKEFAQDQYRHCKTILVSGTASALLEAAGIPADEPDAGLIVVPKLDKQRITQFIDALAKHRHFERETDPPMV